MKYFRLDGVKIKSPQKVEAMKEAGRLSARALEAVASSIEPGISTAELDAIAEEVIASAGGRPAFKGYRGFPATICASINETVVHGIPDEARFLEDGDIISVDTGAFVDGWVGDNAATFAVGDVEARIRKLLNATEVALAAGIEQAFPGKHLGDIGYAVQRAIEGSGFIVVRDFTGHGVGRRMHEPPSVFNFGRPGEGLMLEEGMVIAIEPMACMGTHEVKVLDDGWTVVTCDGKPAAHFERTIAITKDGPLILTPWNLQKKHLAPNYRLR